MSEQKAPERIYLQDEDGVISDGFGRWYETTWSHDQVNAEDVKYTRSDLADRYRAALESLLDMPSACTTDEKIIENNKRRAAAREALACNQSEKGEL